jgi:CBS domain-containing protein
MKVGDLMKTSVMTVDPDTPLKNAARILGEFGISDLPVVNDGGVVVGVVSETDVLFKELSAKGKGERLLEALFPSRRSGRKKAEAETAGEAMTSPAITISSNASVADAGRVMLARAIKRLPVVENGRLVGIVARADLVRAFTRSDEEIADEVSAILIDRFWLQPSAVIIDVSEGRVTVAGEVDSGQTAALLEETLRELPGVVSVNAALMSRSGGRDFSDVPFL